MTLHKREKSRGKSLSGDWPNIGREFRLNQRGTGLCMNLDKFLSLLAAIFGAFGGIYVMLSIMAMSPELMFEQARSKWDFSIPQMEALASQKAENIAGFVFVVVGFVLSIITIAVVPDGVRVFESKSLALALAAVLSGGVYATMHFVSQGVYQNQKHAMYKIAASQCLDRLINHDHCDSADIVSFAQLLKLKVLPDESMRSLTQRIATEVGKILPPDLDYSAVEPKR